MTGQKGTPFSVVSGVNVGLRTCCRLQLNRRLSLLFAAKSWTVCKDQAAATARFLGNTNSSGVGAQTRFNKGSMVTLRRYTSSSSDWDPLYQERRFCI